jgi:hypothetical protein
MKSPQQQNCGLSFFGSSRMRKRLTGARMMSYSNKNDTALGISLIRFRVWVYGLNQDVDSPQIGEIWNGNQRIS